MHGERFDWNFRLTQALQAKGFKHGSTVRSLQWRQDPPRIDKFRKADFAIARPPAFLAHDYEQFIVKENFDVQIVSKRMARGRPSKSNQREIEASVTKLRQVERRSHYVGHIHYQPGMLKGQPLDNRR